jgi:hypothetical protein
MRNVQAGVEVSIGLGLFPPSDGILQGINLASKHPIRNRQIRRPPEDLVKPTPTVDTPESYQHEPFRPLET